MSTTGNSKPSRSPGKRRSKQTKPASSTDSASVAQAATRPVRDQYHHVIPRFILRYFEKEPKISSKETQKQIRATGIDPRQVKFYDIGEQTITARSFSSVYGVKNLYRDVRNVQNVNEVEEKLAQLEGIAAKTIQRLHQSIQEGQSSFNLTRDETQNLRRFLYVMHYRHADFSHTYFDPEHPGNAIGRDRMKKMQTELDLHTSADMWLHFLRYFLDTPHSTLMQHAAQCMKSMTTESVQSFTSLRPDIKNFEAVPYLQQADMYYLGFWKAAPGKEFVLGHKSFGIWEGTTFPHHEIHKIFIVSPQIAMILRSNDLRKEVMEMGGALPYSSDLMNISLPPARTSYVHGESQFSKPFRPKHKAGSPPWHAEKVLHFMSQHNPDDKYEFSITTLTAEETFAVNCIVLLNTTDNGSITYNSDEAMLDTARRYESDLRNILHGKTGRFAPLLRQLSLQMPAESMKASAEGEPGRAKTKRTPATKTRQIYL